MKFKPHSYQAEAIDFLLRRRCAGIFADPGLGKTAITLKVIERFKTSPKFTGALIIAPLRVIYNTWPAEIEKWDLDISYQILHGPQKVKRLRTQADIHLINPEGLFWLFDYKCLPYKALIIDESSKFKSWKSKRFKVLKKFLKDFQRRIILTGTPAPNSLLDLWSQMYVLDLGASLEPFITRYKDKFFYPSGYNNYQFSLRDGAAEQIQERVKPHVLRIDSKTHLDLPDLVYNNVEVELPLRAAKQYKSMEKKLFAELDEDEMFASTAGVAYNYCCQLANGGIYDQSDRGHAIEIHDEKTKATVDLVAELQGKPALIAYRFKHDLARLLGAFPKAAAIGLGAEQDAQIIADWNKGRVPVLLAQSASIAHGLNLQHGGHDIIWYGLTDNLEDYIQLNRRIGAFIDRASLVRSGCTTS
jgi:SNF2 family DNA or RNA helicase